MSRYHWCELWVTWIFCLSPCLTAGKKGFGNRPFPRIRPLLFPQMKYIFPNSPHIRGHVVLHDMLQGHQRTFFLIHHSVAVKFRWNATWQNIYTNQSSVRAFRLAPRFNLLVTDFLFQILAHPLFKMWVIQKPNKVALWNKRHFEEKKMEIIQHV